ncbi:MAG: VPLPA-CTERM sorting domain-containing protein, partial [Rhodobacteraceae bacterium]|nr:VPLPA-CTERM sorting domain-containing protein [Paracoccaceae bacterium]
DNRSDFLLRSGTPDFAVGGMRVTRLTISAVTVTPPGGPTDPVDPPDVSVVPLPAGLPLLLAGLGALAVLRRRT